MMRILSFVLSFMIINYGASALAAMTSVSPALDDNIHINADRMNQSMADGMYTAEGNVVVIWQGVHLTADQVRYGAQSHLLHARGSVVMKKETAVLKGQSLTLNMETGRAEMDSTVLTLPDSNTTITAGKLVRMNETEFSATSTDLTTCDLPDPSWNFTSESLKVNLLGYATGRNIVFYVKNVPVLYIPWIAFPVVLEKRSGLLFPQFGYSKKRGARLDIPAYWVISPSQDLQLDLDILTKRGVGTEIDYRYIRTRGSEGHIDVYAIYDQQENRWRWQLGQEHKEIFSRDANIRTSVNATSDRTFLDVFGDKNGEYNRQSSDTTINGLKTWNNYAATLYFLSSQDLYTTDTRKTLQVLPALGVAAVRQPLYTLPLYFDLDSSAENLYRAASPHGQRLHIFPRITLLPFQNGIIQTSLFAGTHVRGYATETGDTRSTDGDLLPEAGIRISTSLSRIYDTNAATLKKIRHELIPEIRYSYVTEHDQQRLPFYDIGDRMIPRNMVSLSMTSLIGGKFVTADATEYRDMSRIKLSADYKISGERQDLLTLVEGQRTWSDLMLESETHLTKQLKITFDTGYNLYEKHLSTAVAGVEVDDHRGNTVGVGYQMARNEIEYFEGRLSTKLITPLNLSYTARYSFDRSDFLESVYAAEYRHKCWSVNLAVHQRPGNQSYTVNFNLAGLSGK
jgi:LPS-assembly protein